MRRRTDEERQRFLDTCAELEAEAEAKSPFTRWQLVRIARLKSLRLTKSGPVGVEREEDDPDKYHDSRVVRWDVYGRVHVAIRYYDNPHLFDWCWSDDAVTPLDKEDWFPASSVQIGDEITFTSDINVGDYIKVGDTVEATVIGPHTEPGDWIIEYTHFPPSRVVNERIMNL